MTLSDNYDLNSNVLRLINELLSGVTEASDFRLQINQFSTTKVRNLFRDSLPQFSSKLRDKFVAIFLKHFFNNRQIEFNDLWKFVGYRDFWCQVKKFHDFIYSRDMNFNNVIQYFERNLLRGNTKPRFGYLEKKIIEWMDKNPSILNKEIANKLDVSQKKVSIIIKNLKTKGIFLGSLVDYKRVDSFEFFSFSNVTKNKKDILFFDEYTLFPNFKLTQGVLAKKINDNSLFYVLNKKTFCNVKPLNHGISIQDWQEHVIIDKAKTNPSICINKDAKLEVIMNKEYILHLMRNCEIDFKKPNIAEISQRYSISTRTLFRAKTKLKDQGIINPRLIIESDELMTLLVISDKELLELYNKVPYIKTYQIQAISDGTRWISFLSIFVQDFKFLYPLINKKAEIFQIIIKKRKELLKSNSISVIQSEHKIYTN
ncbi:MAG: winged helix-turn-helix domain-containing protein [Asgard group archaeon]|nr:winged helix-turn-helix domain-containing protein [Asgard group archaeon]